MANFRGGFLNQGDPLGNAARTVMLTADGTFLDFVNSYGMLNIESDNTTAANRTFTLTNGAIDGQTLLLVFTSGSSTAAQLADSGNAALSAAWEPTQGDTLTLVWNARLTKWVELARADT